MNERDALIAAVRAQVEKEKAAKAAKLAKEQEMLGQTSASQSPSQTAQKFRPWNPEGDKKAVEDKKEEAVNPAEVKSSEAKTAEETKEGSITEKQPETTKEKQTEIFEGISGNDGDGVTLDNAGNVGETLDNFGLNDGSLEESGMPASGLGLSDDILGGESETKPESTPVIKNSDASDDPVLDEQGNVINVIPVEQKGLDPNNVKSMYDIEFSDDEDEKKYEAAKREEEERLAEEARKAEAVRRKMAELADIEKQKKDKWKAEEEARRKAEEEARKKAEEEARRRA